VLPPSTSPTPSPTGIHAGLYLYLKLPDGWHEPAVIHAARDHGVLVEGAPGSGLTPTAHHPALVLGYGSKPSTIHRGVAVLAALTTKAALSEPTSRPPGLGERQAKPRRSDCFARASV